MQIYQLNCTSCGSPLQIPENTDIVTCPYCRAQLGVKRDQSTITLQVVKQINQAVQQSGSAIQSAVQQSGNAVQSAVQSGAQVTQNELKRLQMSQDLAMLQLQLNNIQSEIRALEREKKNKTILDQINELHIQENDLKQRIYVLQSALTPVVQVPQVPVSPAAPVANPLQPEKKPASGKGFLITGLILFLLGSCVFLVFVLIQLNNDGGVTNNLTGFIGALVLCPLPFVLVGLILAIIGFLRQRDAKAVNNFKLFQKR